jgi:hypothetical protein
MKLAEDAGFDLLLTTDKNVCYQQNLSARRISIVTWLVCAIYAGCIVGPMWGGHLTRGKNARGPAFQPVLPPGKAAAAMIGRPTTRNARH